MVSVGNLKIQQLTSPPPQISGDVYPSFSPDGKKLAFARNTSWFSQDIYIMAIPDGEPEQITFDNRDIRGLTWTKDSSEIIFSSNRDGVQRLWQISSQGGTPEPVSVSGRHLESPEISRDGYQLAYEDWDMDNNVWQIELSQSDNEDMTPTKLISSSRSEWAARLSPDDKKIAFSSHRSGSPELWVCDRNDQNEVKLTSFGGGHTGSLTWSPDGEAIAFVSRPEGNSDVFIINSSGGEYERLTDDPAQDEHPLWSNDGHWLYFSSKRTGRYEIWKVPVASGKAIQLTNDGGYWPLSESEDGKRLYFLKLNPNSIWIANTSDGKESLVVDIPFTNWFNRVAGGLEIIGFKKGIYGLSFNVKSGATLEFFDYETKKLETIANLGEKPTLTPSVSADGRWLLYTQQDQYQADITLVENFR
jgi:Tol biopolymer transport system component